MFLTDLTYVEYQCNGAMAGAKLYQKAPIMIANDVVEQLKDNKLFDLVEAVNARIYQH